MRQKKCRYIIQAIKKWNLTHKEIIQDVQNSRPEYISHTYIRTLLQLLRNKWYVSTVTQNKILYYSLSKEVSGQIDVKV